MRDRMPLHIPGECPPIIEDDLMSRTTLIETPLFGDPAIHCNMRSVYWDYDADDWEAGP